MLDVVTLTKLNKHIKHDVTKYNSSYQIAVIDKDITTAPSSPSKNDRYLILSGWGGGHDNQITEYNGNIWEYYDPVDGMVILVKDEDREYKYYASIPEWRKKQINADELNISNAYTQQFLSNDWIDSGSDYYYLRYTHNLNTYNLLVETWQENGSKYQVLPENTIKIDENNIEIRVSKTPDERFSGRLNVLAFGSGTVANDLEGRVDSLEETTDKHMLYVDIVIKTQQEFENWFGTGEEYKTCNATGNTVNGWQIENQGSQINDENIGTGDGSTTSFNGTLAQQYIRKGSIVIDYTIGGINYQATDDGNGNIIGTHITTGTIDYVTGDWSLTFDSAVDDTTNILCDYFYQTHTRVIIPRKLRIYVKSNPSNGTIEHFKYDVNNFSYKAYILKTEALMKGELLLEGSGIDQTIITKGNNDARFITDYLYKKDNCSTTGSDDYITVADTNNLRIGQTLYFTGDNNFYVIKNIDAVNNKIQVDRDITTAYSGQDVYILTKNIELKELTIDGRGGVNGLGGSITGRVFDLSFCGNSKFVEKLINCKDDDKGAGYKLYYSSNNTINNVSSCSSNGGGSQFGTVGIYGGGLYLYCSSNNIISNVSNCSSADGDYGGGGGLYLSSSSNNTINNVSNCSSHYFGGGLYLNGSSNNTINNVRGCHSVGHGGGLYLNGSSNNTINNVSNCSGSGGGGLYLSSSSNNTINNVSNCSGSGWGLYLNGSSNQNYCVGTWIGTSIFVYSGSYARSGNFGGTLYHDTTWQT